MTALALDSYPSDMKISSPQIKTFEDLECWQACRALRRFVTSQIVPVLPKDERYRLGDQIVRAARSTTANIAEGYGRFHYLDNAKFCSNSRGSCWEVLDHLITAYDDRMISEELFARGREFVIRGVKVLTGYMKYLKRAQTRSAETDEPLTNNGEPAR
jgi:four helix bundle protein